MFVTPNFYKRISAFLYKNGDLTKQTSIDTTHEVKPSDDGRIPGFKIISKKDGFCITTGNTVERPDKVVTFDGRTRVFYDRDNEPGKILDAIVQLIRFSPKESKDPRANVEKMVMGDIGITINDNSISANRYGVNGWNPSDDAHPINPDFSELNSKITKITAEILKWLGDQVNYGTRERPSTNNFSILFDDSNSPEKCSKLNIQTIFEPSDTSGQTINKLTLITDSNPGIKVLIDLNGTNELERSKLIQNAVNSILLHLPANANFDSQERSSDGVISHKQNDIFLVKDEDNQFRKIEQLKARKNAGIS
jgi:hypothetical protein